METWGERRKSMRGVAKLTHSTQNYIRVKVALVDVLLFENIESTVKKTALFLSTHIKNECTPQQICTHDTQRHRMCTL